MDDYKPVIDSAVTRQYGDVRLSYMLIAGFTVSPTPPRMKKIARKIEQELRESLGKPDDSETLRSWKNFAQDMGLNRPDDLPAPRALVEDVLRGRNIPKINGVVDAANITALKFQSPVGVFDIDTLHAPITLRLARNGEGIVPIMASAEVRCMPNEVVYSDRDRIFSRYSRDADFSKITERTQNILCVVDGTNEVPREHILRALNFLESLLVEVGNDGWTCQVRGDAVVASS